MAKAKDNSGEEAPKSADLGRVDDAAANGASAPRVNPLMSSFAAATAIGFNFASQMAGAMLGSLQGAMEATSKLARTLEEERKASAVNTDAVAEAAPDVPAAEAAPVAVAVPVKAPETKAPAKKTTAKKTVTVEAAPVAKAKPVKVAAAKSSPVVAPEPVVAKEPALADMPAAKAPSAAKAKPASKAKSVAKDPPAAKAKSAPKTKPPAADKAAPSKTPARKTSGKSDDLKRISGVGPKVEQVLNSMGVSRFADIAAWSAEDIARFDAELGFAGRIARDGWVDQAKALMGGKG